MVKPSNSSLTKRSSNKPKQKVPRVVLNLNVFRLKEHVSKGTVALSNAATVAGGLSFQLDDISDYTFWQAKFDRYRIVRVDVTMFQCSTTIEIKGASSLNPTLYATVIDLNSSTAAATLNDLRNFLSCRIHNFGTLQNSRGEDKRSFCPRFVGVAEDATTSVVAASSDQGWLNSNRSNIPHYGYRYFFEQLSGAYTGSVKFDVVYHVEFCDRK
jgi:hypothetical protein